MKDERAALSMPRGRVSAEVALCILVPASFGVLALWLGQDANFDLRNYHVYGAVSYLRDRWRIDAAPSYHSSYHNPLLYVGLYWGLEALPPRVFGFLLGTIQGLNFVPLYWLARLCSGKARRRWQVGLAACLALAGLTGAGNLSEVGTTFADNILSLPILGGMGWGLWAVQRAYKKRTLVDPACLVSGLLVGLAAGLKLALALYICALGLAIAVAMPGSRRKILSVTLLGAGFGFGVCLTVLPWARVLWARFGNPLFPYFNDLFRSPWAASWSYRDLRYVPGTVQEGLLRPLAPILDPHSIGEVTFRDARVPVLAVLVSAYLLSRILRRGEPTVSAAFLSALSAGVLAVWTLAFSIYRYLIPLEMAAPAAIWCLVQGARRPFSRTTGVVGLVLLVPVVATTEPGRWGRCEWASQSYLGIELPPWPAADDTIVVLTGRWPLGYLAARIPDHIPILRLEASEDPVRDPAFPGPRHEGSEMNRWVRDQLAANGRRNVFLFSGLPRKARGTLARYGLFLHEPRCVPLKPWIERKPIYRCELEPLQGTAPASGP